MRNKKISQWLTITLLVGACWAKAQTVGALSIDSCFVLAKQNYPLIQQLALIEKIEDYSLANASKGYLPQLHIAGQATYQSDVTAIPIALPMLTIPSLDKDQYRVYGEISQPITNLFILKNQKDYVKANTEIEKQKIEVELYKLHERIDQLFFGILLMDAQSDQVEIHKKDIQAGINKNSVAIQNGVALKNSADALKAELLKANQRTIELNATRASYMDMLALLIGRKLEDNTALATPMPPLLADSIIRPETMLFSLQKKSFDVQRKVIRSKVLPRFNLFFQDGYGKPGLNMLSNEFQNYYIGGLRLNWNIAGFYTQRNEKRILEVNKDMTDIQQQTFLLNTRLALKQQTGEITKMKELIQTDKDIIAMREKIKNSAQNQLELGTATGNDYLIYVNAEDQAKQNMIIHQIQLLMAQYNFKTTTGY